MDLTFGEKIREARKAKNFTQKQLADKIGAKHNSVSDWENNKNKPDPDTIEILCGVLGITPNYLLKVTSEEFSLSEKNIIEKYRTLDHHGKEMVDFTLQKEWERSSQKVENSTFYNVENIPSPLMVAENSATYEIKAARNDHINEEGELEKTLEDISNLKRPE